MDQGDRQTRSGGSRRALSLAALFLLIFGACSSSDPEQGAPSPAASSPDSKLGPELAFFPTHEPYGWQALLDAKLLYERGCLVAGSEGTSNLLLIWPEGFTYQRENGGQVLRPDGTVLAAIGEAIALEGGLTRERRVDEVLAEPIPEACRPDPDSGSIWLISREFDPQ